MQLMTAERGRGIGAETTTRRVGTEASTETRGVRRQGTETRGGRAPRQDTETRGGEAPTRHRDKARRQGSVEELGFVIQVGGLGHYFDEKYL